jgi:signal transduction histidine kinase
MYEFLVRTISESLIDGNKKKSAIALRILRRHYKPDTELYREFRLMNALAKTTVTSEHVAASILSEARAAAIALDEHALDREKSLLIRNINHSLNDENFYDQHVNEYRTFATIQTLINEWRSSDKDIQRVAQFEDGLMKHLMSEKTQGSDSVISEDTNGTARLLMKVMTKKLNEKYSDVLNEHQRSLIKAYAYSTASSDQTSIRMKLQEIKGQLLGLIDNYAQENSTDYVNPKLQETRDELVSEGFDVIDDETVTRFMLYSRLADELSSKE